MHMEELFSSRLRAFAVRTVNDATWTVTRATATDVETVRGTLEEAARRITAKGISQWQPGSFHAAVIAAAIARGEVYLAWQGDEAIGTLALQWADPVIWSDVPDDGSYVHKLAVREAYAGRGIGLWLLRWAEGAVATAGRQYLRLDCMAENTALCVWYRRAGFTDRGIVHGQGWSARRFEKAVHGSS